jgi:hypothetical protein
VWYKRSDLVQPLHQASANTARSGNVWGRTLRSPRWSHLQLAASCRVPHRPPCLPRRVSSLHGRHQICGGRASHSETRTGLACYGSWISRVARSEAAESGPRLRGGRASGRARGCPAPYPVRRVLDLGCGTSRLAPQLAGARGRGLLGSPPGGGFATLRIVKPGDRVRPVGACLLRDARARVHGTGSDTAADGKGIIATNHSTTTGTAIALRI